MNTSSVLVLLKAALALLLAVQSNAALPASVSSSAVQLAQQAISEATALLSVPSPATAEIFATPSVASTPNSSIVPTATATQSIPAIPQFSYQNVIPVANQTTPTPSANPSPVIATSSTSVSVAPTNNSSCVVQTNYCGAITIPNGSYAEDTHMCGVSCNLELCQNGTLVSASSPVGPGAQVVSLSCSSEPYSE